MGSPYVISSDLEVQTMPPGVELRPAAVEAFREGLIADLEGQGKEVRFLPFELIRSALDGLSTATSLNIVSLDRNYVDAARVAGFLDISRACDSGFGSPTYVERPGRAPLASQFDDIGDKLAGEQLVLVDDVLFSGGIIEYVSSELDKRNVHVAALIAGVAVGAGVKALADRGIPTDTELFFEEVEDELCERDFTVLPSSGKRLMDLGKRALYWVPKPYSDHESMASISEEHIDAFYGASIARNIEAFGVSGFRACLEDVYGKEFIEESLPKVGA